MRYKIYSFWYPFSSHSTSVVKRMYHTFSLYLMVDRGDTSFISWISCDTKVPKLVKCNIALVCDSCDIAFTRFGTLLHRPRPMRYSVCILYTWSNNIKNIFVYHKPQSQDQVNEYTCRADTRIYQFPRADNIPILKSTNQKPSCIAKKMATSYRTRFLDEITSCFSLVCLDYLLKMIAR